MNTSSHKTRILFVCLGNICRSPAGEGILRKLVQDQHLTEQFLIDSAGTASYHTGELPDKRMRAHGARRGYTFDSPARQFEVADFNRFDYILVMDHSNYHNVMTLCSEKEAEQRVYSMATFLTQSEFDHIPDPYYEGDDGFELVLDLLEESCTNLLHHIVEKSC